MSLVSDALLDMQTTKDGSQFKSNTAFRKTEGKNETIFIKGSLSSDFTDALNQVFKKKELDNKDETKDAIEAPITKPDVKARLDEINKTKKEQEGVISTEGIYYFLKKKFVDDSREIEVIDLSGADDNTDRDKEEADIVTEVVTVDDFTSPSNIIAKIDEGDKRTGMDDTCYSVVVYNSSTDATVEPSTRLVEVPSEVLDKELEKIATEHYRPLGYHVFFSMEDYLHFISLDKKARKTYL